MTRINIGISPAELCDKHIAAEIHELPRVFVYSVRYSDKRGSWPVEPILNNGHVKWCANHQAYCYARLLKLRDEAKIRGMDGWYKAAVRVICIHRIAKSLSNSLKDKLSRSCLVNIPKEKRGREILKPRIIQQINNFKNPAKWSYPRKPPEWVLSQVEHDKIIYTQI